MLQTNGQGKKAAKKPIKAVDVVPLDKAKEAYGDKSVWSSGQKNRVPEQLDRTDPLPDDADIYIREAIYAADIALAHKLIDECLDLVEGKGK